MPEAPVTRVVEVETAVRLHRDGAVRTGRCTGHCCTKFKYYLGVGDPGEERYQPMRARPVEEVRRLKEELRAHPSPPPNEELNFTIDMLIPLRNVLYKGRVVGLFDCKYFDHATRDCSIYEQRPEMCRVTGTTALPCGQPRCTYKPDDEEPA